MDHIEIQKIATVINEGDEHAFNFVRPVRKLKEKPPVLDRTGGIMEYLCLLSLGYFNLLIWEILFSQLKNCYKMM